MGRRRAKWSFRRSASRIRDYLSSDNNRATVDHRQSSLSGAAIEGDTVQVTWAKGDYYGVSGSSETECICRGTDIPQGM